MGAGFASLTAAIEGAATLVEETAQLLGLS
jgi:hypothetical protein